MKLVTGEFNDSFPPVMDGVANVTRNYAYWLNKKHGQSYVITPSFPGYVDKEEFKVLRYTSFRIPRGHPYRLGVPQVDFSFQRQIRRIPFDIVHAHCPFSSGKMALRVSRKRNIPLVATFHSKYYKDFKDAFKLDMVAKSLTSRIISFFNSADSVWTVNQSSADTLRSYGFEKKVEVVENGTDFVPPADLDKVIREINDKLGFPADELVFLFVGQHEWKKNLKMLILALHGLKQAGLGFRMLFVGTGCSDEAMKDLVKKVGLVDEVVFLGVVLDREFLKSLFARADLFLFPSLYDNSPLVLREAAAVRCPSVVVEHSNAAEGIIDGVNGFVCENSPEAFARKIKQAISDPHRLERVGKTAQETLYRSWEDIVEEVNDRYGEIIERHKRRTSVV